MESDNMVSLLVSHPLSMFSRFFFASYKHYIIPAILLIKTLLPLFIYLLFKINAGELLIQDKL